MSLQDGLEAVKVAIELDGQGNKSEAVKHYDIAISYFREAASSESNQQRRRVIETKIGEYAHRAADLRKSLPPPATASTGALHSANFHAPGGNGASGSSGSGAFPHISVESLPAYGLGPNARGAKSSGQSTSLAVQNALFPGAQSAGGPNTGATGQNALFPGAQSAGGPNTSAIGQNVLFPGAQNQSGALFPSTQPQQMPPQQQMFASTQPQQMPQQQLVPARGLSVQDDYDDEPIQHPMIVRYSVSHPKERPNLQVALDMAELAQKEDKNRNYQAALDLYTDVLERFMVCYNAETNPRIRESLRETMASYIGRAEKIKEAFKLTPTPEPSPRAAAQAPLSPQQARMGSASEDQMRAQLSQLNLGGGGGPPPPPSSSSSFFGNVPPSSAAGSSSLPSMMGAPSLSTVMQAPMKAPALGEPITVSNKTKSLMGRKVLHMTATLMSGMVACGEKAELCVEVINESTMVVEYLKVTLRSHTRKAVTDSKGRNTMDKAKDVVRREEFYQGSIFPLQAESNYKGTIHFAVPPDLPVTNLQHAGFFEREYDLKIECVLSMRSNLIVYMPIALI
jgi:MIT (microtubule interacting and transport) domain/Arrestin (or S-antigen), C-terminal domain